jgi:hypothetical protein
LALLLPAAAQAEPEIYHRLDFYLAEFLPSVRVRQATDRGALRAAVVFGSRCRATAFHLYLQSILGARQPTLSAAESRILLDSVSDGANAEKLRSAASVYPKFDDEVILREALDSLRPIAEANRRDDPARDRILRDFFSARLESWVVPVGYLLARAFGQSGWPAEVALLISRYLPSDRSAFGWLKLGRDKTPIVPRDALQVVRAFRRGDRDAGLS